MEQSSYGRVRLSSAASVKVCLLLILTSAVAVGQTFGEITGRNTVIGPSIFSLDAYAHKEFRMPYREGHTLQFRLF